MEYSLNQKSFHIETLGEILDGNLRRIMRGFSSDYVIVDGPGTLSQMMDKCLYFQSEFGLKQFRMEEILDDKPNEI